MNHNNKNNIRIGDEVVVSYSMTFSDGTFTTTKSTINQGIVDNLGANGDVYSNGHLLFNIYKAYGDFSLIVTPSTDDIEEDTVIYDITLNDGQWVPSMKWDSCEAGVLPPDRKGVFVDAWNDECFYPEEIKSFRYNQSPLCFTSDMPIAERIKEINADS